MALRARSAPKSASIRGGAEIGGTDDSANSVLWM